MVPRETVSFVFPRVLMFPETKLTSFLRDHTLRRLERVFCCTRARNLHQDARVSWMNQNKLTGSSLRKQPSFFTPDPSGVSREGRLRFTDENSILMTKICPASGHERWLVWSVIMHNKVCKYAGQWKYFKLGLTSLHDFDGLWHLYICHSLFGYSTFLPLHSCLWRALYTVL